MARLRHIALAVSDIAASARFYEESFGLQRLRQSEAAVILTDGVINITLLHLPTNRVATPDERGPGFTGVHHIGFQVDDPEAASISIVENGGMPHGEAGGGRLADAVERKFLDPDGLPFDVANGAHVRRVWQVPEQGALPTAVPDPQTAGHGPATAVRRVRA